MTARIITYECELCGHRIVSAPTGETSLQPIYCCGAVVTEVSSVEDKQARQKKTAVKKTTKKTVKKVTKKTAKKEVPPKKKGTAKKTSAKK